MLLHKKTCIKIRVFSTKAELLFLSRFSTYSLKVSKIYYFPPIAVFFIFHQPTAYLHFCILLLLSFLCLLFSHSFYNFSKDSFLLSLTHILLCWKIPAAASLSYCEWWGMLLIQCRKDRWYNESSGWHCRQCQNKGWP